MLRISASSQRIILTVIAIFTIISSTSAQSKKRTLWAKTDSILSVRYNKGDIDTAYITRPTQKWAIIGRLNFSGQQIETEGIDEGTHFKAKMNSDYKTTASVAVRYLGVTLSVALNPTKLWGKYKDYELNFNSYGKRFGFDVIYHESKNFKGWHDFEGMERIKLPANMLSVKTLNLNAYYSFNYRKFSYPAAFSQSYIQRRSAGSFLLAASAQGQRATLKWAEDQESKLKVFNIGIGAGYGYNFVPHKGWLLHISALPTFIVYSNTSMRFQEDKVSLKYHFPETIITGRGAIVRNWSNKYLGLSMVYTFTNIGDDDSLEVLNDKWRIRAFFGIRL